MSKLQYKNISKLPQTVVGIGLVAPGKTIEVDEPIENPNFEEVKPAKQNVSKDDK